MSSGYDFDDEDQRSSCEGDHENETNSKKKKRKKRGRSFSLSKRFRKRSSYDYYSMPRCSQGFDSLPLGICFVIKPPESASGSHNSESESEAQFEVVEVLEGYLSLEAWSAGCRNTYTLGRATATHFVPITPIAGLNQKDLRKHLRALEYILPYSQRKIVNSEEEGIYYIYVVAELLNQLLGAITKRDINWEKDSHVLFCVHRLLLRVCELWSSASVFASNTLQSFLTSRWQRIKVFNTFPDICQFAVIKLAIPETMIPWKLLVKVLLDEYFVHAVNDYCSLNPALNIRNGGFSDDISDNDRKKLLFQYMCLQLQKFCLIGHLCALYGGASQAEIYDSRFSQPTPKQLHTTSEFWSKLQSQMKAWEELEHYLTYDFQFQGNDSRSKRNLLFGERLTGAFFKRHVIRSCLLGYHEAANTDKEYVVGLAQSYNIEDCRLEIQLLENQQKLKIFEEECSKVKLKEEDLSESLQQTREELEGIGVKRQIQEGREISRSRASVSSNGTEVSTYDPMQEEELLYRRMEQVNVTQKRGCFSALFSCISSTKKSERNEKGSKEDSKKLAEALCTANRRHEATIELLDTCEIRHAKAEAKCKTLEKENHTMKENWGRMDEKIKMLEEQLLRKSLEVSELNEKLNESKKYNERLSYDLQLQIKQSETSSHSEDKKQNQAPQNYNAVGLY
mmetsp:Transcript_2852/g.3848  ORF Transcript_2852/g.3848 Transcript_2852/m.3848 type:complete len:679 (+) Transcript_2852:69-2105(+)|eukprot:CAMPEP_0204862838 /NCGR_PEP_ID=MMETSP1348-20121228/2853_1 /ASSEMBLY_ACC=CAM_ASM_000700 /TAXON_ID=215587 /ORGANISM="Aplanochytrium stocchinoi, Strain GSBS06" /LENGTH=678 /DNA_ID=CAMNT_0052012967 /DNA_START=133 /DNA_END=2169 /DNA_ORIENTATION=-